MTHAVATRFSAMSTKLQVSTAAVAIATAAAITPAIAHAAPNIVSIAEGLGDSASLVVSPVVVPSAASSATSTCDPGNVGCYLVEGLVAGTKAFVRGAVIYVGTVAYVVVEGTGQFLKLIGLTQLADGVLTFANNIAVTLKVGPYLTGV